MVQPPYWHAHLPSLDDQLNSASISPVLYRSQDPPSRHRTHRNRGRNLNFPYVDTRLKGCFGQDQLMISDPAGLKYVLNSQHFRRGPFKDSTAHLLYGDKSVVTVDEHAHKRLSAALNVGFTATAVRKHLPVFEKVARMVGSFLFTNST
ncbi:hypothetical protein B0H13DRAFT_669036 [Mycena leptocephala]|nr:hypothetical protein B0H13DRAFT_669036 [Mycena leptocephala]